MTGDDIFSSHVKLEGNRISWEVLVLGHAELVYAAKQSRLCSERNNHSPANTLQGLCRYYNIVPFPGCCQGGRHQMRAFRTVRYRVCGPRQPVVRYVAKQKGLLRIISSHCPSPSPSSMGPSQGPQGPRPRNILKRPDPGSYDHERTVPLEPGRP